MSDTNLKYVPHYNVRQVFNLEQEYKSVPKSFMVFQLLNAKRLPMEWQ